MSTADTIRRSLERDLANVEDNLYRFRAQQRSMPGWRSGNDESITDVIASIEQQRDELREALGSIG